MENEKTVDESIEEVEEITPDTELNEDTTDWKAEALKSRAIAKRRQTRIEKFKAQEAEAKARAEVVNQDKKTPEKKGFDYGEKAFLVASGIKTDEFALVEEIKKSTGKSLEEVLSSRYFQAELKERRDATETQKAIPSGNNRPSSPARDSVEYHIAKGTNLLEIEDMKLRNEVLKEKRRLSKQKNVFSPNPIV